jgi:pimeloyl-ACP methyl ester carboxylesterase
VRLGTRSHGEAGERRILLIHGITANAAGWWRVGADLAARGWHVVAPDLRGHGDTGPADSYLFADQAADVLALGSGWDAVLGHSMGGAVAVTAATIDPTWTKGLILQDPAVAMPSDIDQVIDWLVDDYRRPITAERLSAESPRWAAGDVETKAEALRATTAEMVEETIRVNWPWMLVEETAALAVPTVIIGSDPATGGLLPVTLGEWFAAANPRVRYVVLPDSSHSAHRDADAYEAYLATLVDALALLPTLR